MALNMVSTGSGILDDALRGGYENEVVTTIYGPAGAGKTNLCLLCLVNTAKQGKKVIFIDTEGGFSLARLEQIDPEFKKILDNMFLFKPTTFDEQKKVFEQLKGMIDDDKLNEKIGLIIVDSVSMLYRLEMGKNGDSSNISIANKELGYQVSVLTEIARKKNIPVLLTNQVYSSFDERDKVNMVGGDILKYGSKCLIELQKFHGNRRKFVLKKHRSLPEDTNVVFSIVDKGIEGI